METAQSNQSVQPYPVLPQQPVYTPPAQPNQPDAPKKFLPLLIVFGIVALGIVLLLIFMVIFRKNIQSPSYTQVTPTTAPRQATAVVGKVHFEGYAPQGAYISLAERSEGKGQFKEVVTGLPIDNSIDFSWTDATAGKNYELQALLKVQGKAIEKSPIIDVSAPASGVSLTIVSELNPPAPSQVTMAGQINLDGYAPSGSMLQVLAQASGSSIFQTVVTTISPTDNAPWSWNTALNGQTYAVRAQLVSSSGVVISTGDTQTITAPSTGLVLNVASTATPPAPAPTGISGTITINGSIPSGSYVTFATRPTGTGTFNQVASNLSATNGVSFAWNNATSGSQYDIQAYLWANGKPYAQSNILTVTAPSTFDQLTINAQQALQAPSGNTITVSCGGDQNNLAQATINFNTQSNLNNAVSYNIIATLASQNNQVMNTTLSPSNPGNSQSITTSYIFQSGATYYAQYAYTTSTGGQMSPLSPSVQFACQ